MPLLRLKPFLVPPFYALAPSGLAPRFFLSFAFSCRSSPSQLPSSTVRVSIEYEPWSGLQSWRESPVNEDRFWGPHGPQPLPRSRLPPPVPGEAAIATASSLSEMGAVVLSTSDPVLKSQLSHIAFSRWRLEGLPVGVWEPPDKPARPTKPRLVSPKEIPAPKDSGLPLNAYMLHNLAHVELNAIDLAWDTVVRFSPFLEELGEGFFADFAHVADDESRHFGWCSQRLMELGFRYGDMPAHNMLWKECEKSSDDVSARLAVIPMVQEARGLDAGPRLVERLVGFGDNKTSKIVAQIAEEETAHVSVGVDWFIALCRRMNLPPSSTFKGLLREYNVEVKGPFNHSAREKAGIPRDWYDPSSSIDTLSKEEEQLQQLTTVHDRLARIIALESENSQGPK